MFSFSVSSFFSSFIWAVVLLRSLTVAMLIHRWRPIGSKFPKLLHFGEKSNNVIHASIFKYIFLSYIRIIGNLLSKNYFTIVILYK